MLCQYLSCVAGTALTTTYQISTAVTWYTTSALAIVTDIAIIALPVNEIRRLQLPRVQKLMLTFLFSLGLLYSFTHPPYPDATCSFS